jgi:hypothetical protein
MHFKIVLNIYVYAVQCQYYSMAILLKLFMSYKNKSKIITSKAFNAV